MLKGVYVTLLIGPVVPIPVPQVVLEALTSLEVTSNTGGPSGFQLSFSLNNRSPLHTTFLVAARGAAKRVLCVDESLFHTQDGGV